MKIVDTWSGGIAPSTKPGEGNVWYVDTDCTFNGESYKAGDWIYYHNSSWNRADLGVSVKSVNGKSGESITLTPADVKAISEDYIDYTIGADIPQNKIVVTDKDRHIAGATVDNLTKEFSIGSTNGDVSISATKSTNLKTDGSKNLNLTMEITQDGYDNIATKLRRDIKNNNSNVPFRKNLNFVDFAIADDSGTNTVTIKPDYTNVDEILYFNGTLTDDFKKRLTNNYYNKNDRPFYITYRDANNRIQLVGINGSIADAADNTTISIPTGEYSTTLENSKVVTKTSKANISFDGTGMASAFSITRSTATEALPISGGTMTGDIIFSAVEVGENSKAIKFSGGTDNANIYYSLPASDQGKLIFEMTDDDNTEFIFRNKNTAVAPNWTKEVKISKGEVTATTFRGNATSATSAASATKATQDSDGNAINTTYLKKSGDTMTGTITSRNLTPSANNTYSVGTSSARYSNGYFTNTNTTNLIVNGKKVFIQSGTPSGASNGDIWIVTK